MQARNSVGATRVIVGSYAANPDILFERVRPSLALRPPHLAVGLMYCDWMAMKSERGGVYVAFQLYQNTVVLETSLGRDLAWQWGRMAHELVHQTCWGQVSDGSHHTRSEVTGLNEVNERLGSVCRRSATFRIPE